MFGIVKRGALTAIAAFVLATAGLVDVQVLAASYPQIIRIPPGKALANKRIKLGVNKSVVVELGEYAADVLVSNPEVADAVVRSSRQVYVMAGAKPGQTNVFVFGKGGRRLVNLEISIELDVNDLERSIRGHVEGSQVKAESVNGSIVLSGTVQSPIDAKRAFDIAARFAGADDKVLSMIAVRGKEQVNLRVVIAEVQRNVIKQLGVDLAADINAGNFGIGLISENPFPVQGKTLSSSRIRGSYGWGNSRVSAQLRALEQNGVMRILSEPNLTAISGESSDFLVGGEFPVPVGRDSSGRITIEFKQYGVGLAFTPVVMSGGRISLRIKTEVSELSNDGALQLEGGGDSGQTLTLPALRVRRAESTVELPSGGSIVMAGLIKDDIRQALHGWPGLMKLPILGALFKSRDYQRSQTELAIFVTPLLVDPVATSSLVRPDKNYAPASDAAGTFLNRLNRMYRLSGDNSSGNYYGRYGFIYD